MKLSSRIANFLLSALDENRPRPAVSVVGRSVGTLYVVAKLNGAWSQLRIVSNRSSYQHSLPVSSNDEAQFHEQSRG